MAEISIESIKKLKELSGVGLTDAKQALVEANGDFDEALKAMRKKGLTKAEKCALTGSAEAEQPERRTRASRAPQRSAATAKLAKVSSTLTSTMAVSLLSSSSTVKLPLSPRLMNSKTSPTRLQCRSPL